MPALDGRDACFVHAEGLEPARERARAAGGAARRVQVERAAGRVRLAAAGHWRLATRDDAVAALADVARAIAEGTIGARDANALVAALDALRAELPARRGVEKVGEAQATAVASAITDALAEERPGGEAHTAGRVSGNLSARDAARAFAALYGAAGATGEAEALAQLLEDLERASDDLLALDAEGPAPGTCRAGLVDELAEVAHAAGAFARRLQDKEQDFAGAAAVRSFAAAIDSQRAALEAPR